MESIQLIIYAIIGAIIFGFLGFLAMKYRGDTSSSKTVARDAVSGAFFLLFLQFLVPGYFPSIDTQIVMDQVRTMGGGQDMELQFTMPMRH